MDYLSEFIFLKRGRRNRGDRALNVARSLKRRGYSVIVNQLCSDYYSRFKWRIKGDEGSTIDTTVIEKAMLFNGRVAFTRDLPDGLKGYPFACQISGSDNKSFYGKPSRVGLTDWGGKFLGHYIPALWSDLSNIGNCVVMEDNSLGVKPFDIVLYYADQLSEIYSKVIQCIQNITGASFIFCTEEQSELVNQAYRDADSGKPRVIVFNQLEGLDFTPISISTPGAEEALKTLYESRDKTYADFLQSIGIQANNEIDKKSGTTPLEIVGNRQVINLRLNDSHECRKQGLKLLERIGINNLELSLDNFESITESYDDQGNIMQGGAQDGLDRQNEQNKDINVE